MRSSAAGRAASALRRRQRGFTLLELLLVVSLIAGLTVMVANGSGMLNGTRLRAASALILSSVRSAMARANSTGLPVRLVFDLQTARIQMEETHGRMLRVESSEEGSKAGAQAATQFEQQAADYARDIMSGPHAPAATFVPVPGFVKDGGDPAQGRLLGVGIRYIQVQTEHDLEPRTEGRAYLYFWPGGGTERASIQLTSGGDSTGVSVLVSALTGRANVVRGRVELDEGRRDLDFQEREEP